MSGDFSIGSTKWPGISKLIEECGEVVQVCGKLIAIHGETSHWDGTNLRERLEDELGDLLAAHAFVVKMNGLDGTRIRVRNAMKQELFRRWHEEQSE
jgi:NTP pyrophosphatase (non-canonical NTP hydrolase)